MIDVSPYQFELIKDILKKHVSDCEVRAFGSRVTWTAKDYSDLDLAIVGKEKLSTRTIFSIKEAFQESDLSFRVDVLDWNAISKEFQSVIKKKFEVIQKAAEITKNEVYSKWQTYKLSEIMVIIGGGTPKTTVKEYWGGDIPWLSIVDFGGGNRWVYKTEKTITQKGLEESSAKILKKGQLVISARGTVGEIAQIGGDMAFNQSCYGLDGKPSLIINDFLYYLLKFNVGPLKQNTHGAVFDTITRQTFDCIDVDLPPLPEQAKIARNLGDLDEKIELNQQMNKTLEATAQALFNQWFVEFEFPGHEKTKFINGLPDGWKAGTFGEVSINFDSKRVPLSSRERDGRKGEYPYYGAASIVDYVDNFLFDGVYVLLGEDGTVITDDGFPVLQYVWGKFWVNNHAHVLQGKNDVSTEFIMLFLRQTNIQHIVTGAVQPKINQNNMNNIAITIPEKTLLDEFQQVIKPIYEKFRNNAEETNMLIKTRDSLLPKLMTGKIRIQEKD